MSRIIAERIVVTMHTDLERLGKFRGATVDRKELLNDGRLIDAGQHALGESDVNQAIASINAEAIAQLTELQADYDAKVAELQTAQATVSELQAELEAIRNPPNPFPDADWSGFRVAALSDPAVQRVAVGNPVLWPLLLMFLNELSSNPARAADIAGLWNMMETVVPVTTEEIARVNTIAESKQVPFRLNADGQIGQV